MSFLSRMTLGHRNFTFQNVVSAGRKVSSYDGTNRELSDGSKVVGRVMPQTTTIKEALAKRALH